jgi:hypothetical protein
MNRIRALYGTGVRPPAGHIVNDSQLIAGAWIMPIDRSSMETPSGAVSQEGLVTGSTPWVAQYFIGFDFMNYIDKKPFKSTTGVFDFTNFKTPTHGQLPRIY